MIELRPYQEAAVNRIRAAYSTGRRAPLLVLPTGGGKTVTFSYITQSASQKGKCVWLIVHRAELVKQIANTLARFECQHQIMAPSSIVRQCQAEQFRTYGRSFVHHGARVLVGSVQTVIKRLDTIPADMRPDLIVVDEAHHLTGGTMWGQVVDRFTDAKVLAVTATPCRLDGKGLGVTAGGFCDELIMGPTMSELIAIGALSPYEVFCPPTVLDLTGVRTRAGDYAKEQLAGAVDRPTITGDAVQHYQRLSPGKRAVAFCVSVEHAKHVAAEFSRHGVISEFLDGTMDPTERDRILKRFEAGDIQVLTSCDIISEGFDVPAIEVAILLRPTQSLSLFLQQVGRALRPFPGKAKALIIDHVGNVGRWDGGEFRPTHGLPDEEREWSLDGAKARKKKAANDNEPPGVDRVASCPKCYTVHLPAPECPSCGHIYPERSRVVQQTDGELREVTSEHMEQLRRARRIAQGKLQTVDELMHTAGMSRFRAQKVIEARDAKNRQRQSLLDHVQAQGGSVHQVLGVTFHDLMRMKPKELADLQARTKVPA